MKKKEFVAGKVKRRAGRILAFALAGSLVIGALTGCGGKGKKASSGEFKAEFDKAYASGEFDAKAVTDGVKLTIAVPSNSLVKDWETNNMTKIVEDTLGVDLEFMVLPSSDYSSKLNVMVLGGDALPDIIFNPTGWESWVEEGAIIELSDFYEDKNVSANIQAAIERGGTNYVDYMRLPDESVYTLPQISEEYYTPVRQKIWVYQPWLDALGLEVPETMEEFYNACKMVVANDMNGNGKADEIGMTGTGLDEWFDCMMSSFVYAHQDGWRIVDDGKVDVAYTTKEWKEGLKYLKKFFDEGLIPGATLTQSKDDYKALYYASNPVVFAFADWNYTGTNLEIRKNYTAIPCLEGPSGEGYSCDIPTVPNAGAVITTDCENPMAAFLVCDLLCSQDLSITSRYGEQGVDWDYWDVVQNYYGNADQFVPTFEGHDIVFYPYDMIGYWSSTEAQNAGYRQVGPYILDINTTAGAGVWKDSDDELVRAYAELELATAEAAMACYEDQPKEVYDYAPLELDERQLDSDVSAALLSYVKEVTSEFLVGEKDIDKDWEAYLKELDTIGIEDYIKLRQKAYDRAH